MSLFLLFIIVLFVICGIIGFKKGFLGYILPVIYMIISLLVASFFAPIVANKIVITSAFNKPIENYVEEKVSNANIENLKMIDKNVSNKQLGELEKTFIVNGAGVFSEQINKYVGTYKLPKTVATNLFVNKEDVIEAVQKDNVTYKDITLGIISKKIGKVVNQLIIFTLIFIITFVVLMLIKRSFQKATKFRVIGYIDGSIGAILGLIFALLITWIIMTVITLFVTNKIGYSLLQDINNSKFLSYLYKNNLFLNLVL